MIHTVLRSLSVLMFAALLAAVSAVSAGRMAPDQDALDKQAILHVYGATLADLCGPEAPGHDHDCPFCHKLPDGPKITAPRPDQRITRLITDDLGRHLVHVPQHNLTDAAPRAPPVSI